MVSEESVINVQILVPSLGPKTVSIQLSLRFFEWKSHHKLIC